jgi:hypothetical protein
VEIYAMNVWTYWEGEKHPFVDICLRSIEMVCEDDDFHLTTPENLHRYLPAGVLREEYLSLPQPALRADAIRAALLATHGGWWWDADTVAIRKPPDVGGARAIYMTWHNLPRRVLNGYLYMEQGVAIPWLDLVNRRLRESSMTVDWCILGESMLSDSLPATDGAVEVDRAMFLPIDIDSEVYRFFDPGNPMDLMNDRTVCFGLNYSWFMYHRRREMLMPPEQWGDSPLLIHRLLTYARSKLG